MEADHSYSVYLGWALVSLALLAAAFRRWTTANAGLRLPPGPWTLPIIGSLHHIVGKLPHRALRDLGRRHGPVMLLRFGEVPTLILQSPDAASAVMKTNDVAFSSRPLCPTMNVIMSEGQNISFAPYGEYWRNLRKIAVTELFTARRVRSFRNIREEEVGAMLHDVGSAAAAGRPIEMRARLATEVSGTTFRAILGDRCKQRAEFIQALETVILLATGFNAVDLWPSSWLARKLTSTLRRAKENHTVMFDMIKAVIREHLDRGDKSGAADEAAEDMLDVLLQMHKAGRVDMTTVEGVVFDLFAGGSDTTTTALEWAMAELVNNPTAMNKATTELRQAFESGGRVDEDKLGQLPYLHHVIRETLRMHPPGPMLLPRVCGETCKVLGYDVPKGTQAFVNAWAVNRHEEYWPNAEEFRPERFEAGGSAANVDFKGTDFELVPFGAGRRMCPGMAFGLASLELPLASLLLHFDWESSDSAKLDMTEVFSVTMRRKAELHLRPTLRVPVPPNVIVT